MKNVTIIDLHEWDSLVEKTYGRTYNFQQQDGCKDRTTVYFSVPDETRDDFENETVPEKVNHPEMGVKFSAWLARDPKQNLPAPEDNDFCRVLWWERNFYPELHTIANDLHKKGLLAAGSYGIEIDW